jgi:hypothetical protein
LSIGFDIGRLKSGSTGLSFVAEFSYSGGTVTNEYTSEAFAYATGAQAILLPQVKLLLLKMEQNMLRLLASMVQNI